MDWSWEGVSQVFAAWGIAPCVAACFGAILFTFTKYGVLHSSDPLKMGMITVPIYFAITSGILTMLIVWKGAASLDLDEWGTAPTVGTIFGEWTDGETVDVASWLPCAVSSSSRIC